MDTHLKPFFFLDQKTSLYKHPYSDSKVGFFYFNGSQDSGTSTSCPEHSSLSSLHSIFIKSLHL